MHPIDRLSPLLMPALGTLGLFLHNTSRDASQTSFGPPLRATNPKEATSVDNAVNHFLLQDLEIFLHTSLTAQWV